MYDKAYYDKRKLDPEWMKQRNEHQKVSYYLHRARRITEMAASRKRRRLTLESAKLWGRKRLLFLARSRAKQRGIECSILLEHVQAPDICPVFGTPLDWFAKVAGAHNPSLDRIDNSKGYTPENVWVISRRANYIKNDATLAELKMLVDSLGKKTAGRKLDGAEHNEYPVLAAGERRA